MKKKLITIMLSAAMIVTMLPAVAFAADEVHAPTTGDNVAPTFAMAESSSVFIAQGVSGKSKIAYTWNAVDGAAKYKVYQSKCGQKKYKLIKTTKGTSFTKKGLTKKKAYKAYVVALDTNGEKLAKTPTIHNAMTGGKHSNALEVSATETLALGVGDSAQIEAAITKTDSDAPLLWKGHTKAQIRYYSSDETIATVDAEGNVTALGVGTAEIVAVAPTGASALCIVNVGISIKIDRVAGQTTNVFDGKIPYATWQEAVAKAWSFTATVDNKKAIFTAINYSDGKLGFKMSYAGEQETSAQKLGLFKAASPCYVENIMADTEAVENGKTYYVSGVSSAPVYTGKNVTLKFELKGSGSISKDVTIPYSKWTSASKPGSEWSCDVLLGKDDISGLIGDTLIPNLFTEALVRITFVQDVNESAVNIAAKFAVVKYKYDGSWVTPASPMEAPFMINLTDNNEEPIRITSDDNSKDAIVSGSTYIMKTEMPGDIATVNFTSSGMGTTTFTLDGEAKTAPFSLFVPSGSTATITGFNYSESTVTITYEGITIATVVAKNDAAQIMWKVGSDYVPAAYTINADTAFEAEGNTKEEHDA